MSSLVAQSIEVIRNRIDELGTTEPTIQRQGTDRVLVQVPGFEDSTRLKDIISRTARLTFHLVHPTMTAAQAEAQGIPAGYIILPSDDGGNELINEDIALGGEFLVDAQPGFDQQTAPLGRQLQVRYPRRHHLRRDHRPRTSTALRHRPRRPGHHRAQHPAADHRRLGPDLRHLHAAERQRPRGPAARRCAAREPRHRRGAHGRREPRRRLDPLGRHRRYRRRHPRRQPSWSIAYGLFGVFANISLVLNIVLMIGALSALGATLTLPGIAGIVLTIGVAVDANVLIYERIREELTRRQVERRGDQRRLPARLGHHHRLAPDPAHRRDRALLPRLRPGAGLRRDAGARHPDLALHRPTP